MPGPYGNAVPPPKRRPRGSLCGSRDGGGAGGGGGGGPQGPAAPPRPRPRSRPGGSGDPRRAEPARHPALHPARVGSLRGREGALGGGAGRAAGAGGLPAGRAQGPGEPEDGPGAPHQDAGVRPQAGEVQVPQAEIRHRAGAGGQEAGSAGAGPQRPPGGGGAGGRPPGVEGGPAAAAPVPGGGGVQRHHPGHALAARAGAAGPRPPRPRGGLAAGAPHRGADPEECGEGGEGARGGLGAGAGPLPAPLRGRGQRRGRGRRRPPRRAPAAAQEAASKAPPQAAAARGGGRGRRRRLRGRPQRVRLPGLRGERGRPAGRGGRRAREPPGAAAGDAGRPAGRGRAPPETGRLGAAPRARGVPRPLLRRLHHGQHRRRRRQPGGPGRPDSHQRQRAQLRPLGGPGRPEEDVEPQIHPAQPLRRRAGPGLPPGRGRPAHRLRGRHPQALEPPENRRGQKVGAGDTGGGPAGPAGVPPTPSRNAALDVEPVYAFRGHRGPVLAVAMGRDSALCCSGGVDACIRRWRLPDLDMDPYDGYDPGVLSGVLEGHGDAVWGLAFNPAGDRLASCSADGTVRLWDPRRDAAAACLSTYDAQSEHGVPTSVTFSATEPGHAVVAFRTGAAVLYDVEAARALLTLETRAAGGGGSQINQVVSHPSQPLSITANDDRGIRFLDNRTGKVVHSMVAHLDAVTCLAVDPNGVFLMSGSHDCSLRLWHLAHKTCVQELTAHRKKHEEAVHAVAFHPSRALSASAGADALAKVFV